MSPSLDPRHETIVAVYATEAHAENAIRDLKASGIPDAAISRHAGTETVPGYGVPDHANEPPQQGFWSRLFGGEPDHGTHAYDRSLESGATVITVRASDTHAAGIIDILERHEPIDIDGHDAPAAAMPAPASAGTAFPLRETPHAEAGETLSLSEEQLTVGKRLVDRGSTRVRRFVVETPVERQVTLHDERVVVERRPIASGERVATADWSDRVIEMTESVEEPVVEKTARVVEEVALRKQATDRVETVRDTVRREDVEIEQVRGDTSAVNRV
jgi:uncharacterized protein (TIGR02271 family)